MIFQQLLMAMSHQAKAFFYKTQNQPTSYHTDTLIEAIVLML